MKYLLMTVVLCVAGYFAWQQFKPKPPPPPPPPPPAILTEPAPIVNPQEQAKIIKSATDQDPDVRWQAILLLDKMNSPSVYDVMFERTKKDLDMDLRIKIINLLGQRGAQKLTVEANPDDPLKPIVMACAIPKEGGKCLQDITEHLVSTAKDPIPEIRLAALQALDVMGNYSAASDITDFLKDPDERVRLQALKTLNSLQDKKAALIAAERKRQEELRRKAEEASKKGLLNPQ